MSSLLIGTNPDKPQVVGAINLEATNEEKARQLPKPSGYRILCAIPEVEKEYVDFYKEKIKRGDTVILDNSAFEFKRATYIYINV